MEHQPLTSSSSSSPEPVVVDERSKAGLMFEFAPMINADHGQQRQQQEQAHRRHDREQPSSALHGKTSRLFQSICRSFSRVQPHQPNTRHCSLNTKSHGIETHPSDSSTDPSSRRLAQLIKCATKVIILGLLIVLTLALMIYYYPLGAHLDFQAKVSPLKPRPKFVGPLGVNEQLDRLGERLFADEFHAPESMAWTRSGRAFYTGVEGGFILLVEPELRRWTIAAKLNDRLSVEDRSRAGFELLIGDQEAAHPSSSSVPAQMNDTSAQGGGGGPLVDLFVPFCERDTDLYGPRAEFEPNLVRLSRCSRPLGIRLAPNETHLYVVDPLSGLFRINLIPTQQLHEMVLTDERKRRQLSRLNHVIKLIDFSHHNQMRRPPPAAGDDAAGGASGPRRQVLFGDDLAVEWNLQGANNSLEDQIYFTDCSLRWPVRYLLWLMLENDDSGRILVYNTGKPRQLRQLEHVTPVSSHLNTNQELVHQQPAETLASNARQDQQLKLSFPNGIELTSNGSALLISDLNNRRILMHHIRGPLRGSSVHLMWLPGYPDNIRRGLDDLSAGGGGGAATYWFACGCAISDGRLELAEVFNTWPAPKRLLVRSLHLAGALIGSLGRLINSASLQDGGLMLGAGWLKYDPYCRHGLVGQFNERGQLLRSLQAPSYSSHFKLLSEASEIARPSSEPEEPSDNRTRNLFNSNSNNNNNNNNRRRKSTLYLGSVYYSYLGRVELEY